jgi:MoaA/NifB/PqqE/SkfB family radical SAM enzyme
MSLPNKLIKKATSENTYCTSPWNEIHIHATGKVRMCCQHEGIDKNINDVTLSEAFGDIEYHNARREVMSGIWPIGCSQCEKSEEHSGSSMRYVNTTKTNNQETWHPTFGIPGLIQRIGIDFSNACNLRCTICDPNKSTGWYKDAKMLHNALGEKESWRAYNHASSNSYGIQIDFVDKNLTTLLKAKQIECGGGEPFYIPQFTYLVEKLIEHNYQGRLKIITNATLLKPKMLKKLKDLNVDFIVSMDGTGHLYPYMRPSTPFGKYTWEEIEQKIINITKEFGITISFTPNIINIYNIPQYIEWVQEKIVKPNNGIDWWKGKFFNEAVTSPEYLRIAVHPDEDYKHRLADMLEARSDGNYFSDIIMQCRKPRTDKEIDDWKFFCKTTDLLDKHRKTSIIKYVPELEKYWIKS